MALENIQQKISIAQAQMDDAGLMLRLPPPLPTSCCGRGCHGCVWESYYSAADYWLEDASQLLQRDGA